MALFLAPGCMPATRTSSEDGNAEDVREDRAVIEEISAKSETGASDGKLLLAIDDWLGAPYRYGGESRSGVDCSAFVQSVFMQVGIELPRTSKAQSQVGSQVSRGNIRMSDLLFFNTSGGGVSHVGIALDNVRFVHASTSKGVIISRLSESYYDKRVLFGRRVR